MMRFERPHDGDLRRGIYTQMSSAAHVLAVGARTAIGRSAESTASALRAGVSRVREHPFLVDAAGARLRCAYDAGLDPDLFGVERMLPLAHHVLGQLADKISRGGPARPVRVLLALPEPRPGFVSSPEEVADALGTVSGMPVEGIGFGHAGALRGIERAAQAIGSGAEDVVVVLGVDSYFEPSTINWLDTGGLLLREETRGGFAPGEGAAAVLLAGERARAALGLPSLARVRSVASSIETRDATGEEGLLGEAMGRVLRQIGDSLREGERITDVYTDINGQRSRTEDWGFAVLRNASLFRDAAEYRSVVSECGELGAASAPLSLVWAVEAWRRRYATGPLALVVGSSWGGVRGAALLEKS